MIPALSIIAPAAASNITAPLVDAFTFCVKVKLPTALVTSISPLVVASKPLITVASVSVTAAVTTAPVPVLLIKIPPVALTAAKSVKPVVSIWLPVPVAPMPVFACNNKSPVPI